MACLDTNFIIDLLKEKPFIRTLSDVLEYEKMIFIPAPVVLELWLGALLSNNPEKEKHKVLFFISSFPILPLDDGSAMESAQIQSELIKKGKKMAPFDLMIAGIARKKGERIITKDPDFTRVHCLEVIAY